MQATEARVLPSVPPAAVPVDGGVEQPDLLPFSKFDARTLQWALEQLRASHPAWAQHEAVLRMVEEFTWTAEGVVNRCRRNAEPPRTKRGLADVAECLAFFEAPRHQHLGDRYPLGLVALLRCLRALDGRWYVMGNEIYDLLRREGDAHAYAPLVRFYVTMARPFDAVLASKGMRF